MTKRAATPRPEPRDDDPSVPLTPLRRIRLDRGFTQQQLADRMGVAKTTISKWEKLPGDPEYRTIRKHQAMRLGTILECHWAELLDDQVPQVTPKEQALLDLYRGLEERDRDAAFRFVDAMAKPIKKAANGG